VHISEAAWQDPDDGAGVHSVKRKRPAKPAEAGSNDFIRRLQAWLRCCALSEADVQLRAHMYDFIMSSPFFLHLTEDEMRAFVRAFKMESYKAGSVIVRQGDKVDKLTILGAGKEYVTMTGL